MTEKNPQSPEGTAAEDLSAEELEKIDGGIAIIANTASRSLSQDQLSYSADRTLSQDQVANTALRSVGKDQVKIG